MEAVLAQAHKAKAEEAKQHHRPSRGLRHRRHCEVAAIARGAAASAGNVEVVVSGIEDRAAGESPDSPTRNWQLLPTGPITWMSSPPPMAPTSWKTLPVKSVMKSVGFGNTLVTDAIVRNCGEPTSWKVYWSLERRAANGVGRTRPGRGWIDPRSRMTAPLPAVTWRLTRPQLKVIFS